MISTKSPVTKFSAKDDIITLVRTFDKVVSALSPARIIVFSEKNLRPTGVQFSSHGVLIADMGLIL